MIVRIFKIVCSVSLARMMNVLGSFFLVMMLGAFGKTTVAAAALALLSANIIFVLSISLLQGLNPLIRQYRVQKKDPSEIGHLIRQGYIIALLCSFASSLVLWHLSELLLLLGQDPQLIGLTQPYFHYAAFSIFPALMLNIFSQVNLGIERYRVLMFMELMGLILRTVLGCVFILGCFSFSPMGLGGLAVADLCSNIIMLSLVMMYIKKQPDYTAMSLLRLPCFLKPNTYKNQIAKKSVSLSRVGKYPRLLGVDKSSYRSILALGVPIAIQTGGEFSAILMSLYLMGYYGVDTLASFQVANQYLTLCLILGFGFTQALTLLVREALYQEQNSQALISRLIKTAMGMALFCNFFIALFFLTHPHFLLSLFINEVQASPVFLTYGTGFLALNAALILLDSIRSILTGALRGLNEAKSVMWIGLFSLWLIAAPVSLLCFFLDADPVSMRLGLIAGFWVWIILLALRLYPNLFSLRGFSLVPRQY